MKKDLNVNDLKYVIYCRKSSDGEDKQIQSIETQLRELKEHAENNKLHVVDIITEKQSAHTPGRPEFEKVLTYIRNGKVDGLLVIRANRISRNALDAGRIITLMDEKKLKYIRTPNSTCYTGSPTDKMMIAFELMVSKKDSDEKGENVKEGLKTKAIKGYPNGIAPIGFTNDKTSEVGNRKWIVDKEKFPLVKKVFREFLTGNYSANSMASWARKELKLTTPQHKKLGGKLIQDSYVHTMLKNPIYAGFFYYNDVRYELHKDIPKMISESEHNRIVQMIEARDVPKTQKHKTIFSGILKGVNGEFIGTDPKFQLICDCKKKFAYRGLENCPNCGSMIKDLNNPKYLHYVYYYNVSKKKRKEKYKSILEQDILEFVKNELVQPLSVNPKFALWAKKNIRHLKDKELVEKTSLKQSVEAVEEGVKKEKEKLRQMLRREVITEEEYKEDLAKIIGSVPKLDLVVEDWSEKLNKIVDIGLECAKILESGNEVAVKDVITQSSSNLIWNEKNLEFKRAKWLDAYINGINDVKLKSEQFEPKNFSRTQLLQGDLEGDVQNLEKYPSLLPDLESNQN